MASSAQQFWPRQQRGSMLGPAKQQQSHHMAKDTQVSPSKRGVTAILVSHGRVELDRHNERTAVPQDTKQAFPASESLSWVDVHVHVAGVCV